MPQRSDQVFQLSLTEIAFTIAFILLLLLGYLVSREQAERKAAEDKFARVQSIESATAAYDAAKSELLSALRNANVASPDEIVTRLVAVEEVKTERDRLKRRVEDLDAQLTALMELRSRIDRAAAAAKPDIAREEVESALSLQFEVQRAIDRDTMAESRAVRPVEQSASRVDKAPLSGESGKFSADASAGERDTKARVVEAIATAGELRRQLNAKLGREIQPGQEGHVVSEVVDAARGYGELLKTGSNPQVARKENADLRGQVAFLKNRLDARGGRDYPPCWADEKTGRVEFLFTVELKSESVVVGPAWLPNREPDARALPGLAEVLSGSPHSNANFVSRIQPIFNKSESAKCRHYVQLKSSIPDAVQSDRARLMVENYFYKVELRR